MFPTYEWMGIHPYLTICLAICFLWFCYLILHYGTNGILRIMSRLIRSINIALRGWPPPHCDADGDFKPITSKHNDAE